VVDLTERRQVDVHVLMALRRLFWLGLAARVTVAVLLHLFVAPETFAPDQYAYDAGARVLANSWASDVPVSASTLLPSGPRAYFRIVAVQYFLFGAYSLIPKLVNCLLGASLIRLIFDIALRMGLGPLGALRAATYVTWFPSLVLWSALNIRDAWVILLIALLCRQALVLQERFALLPLAALVGGSFALVEFRPYLLFAVTAPILVSFIAQRSQHFLRNLVIGSIVALGVIYADQAAGANRRVRFIDFEELQNTRYWNTVGAASQFEQADISTPTGALLYLPRGLALFLLAPFPWMLGSIRQILAVPETLFFYSLFPSMLRGIRELWRRRRARSLVIILMTAGLTVGYALGEGNAGTAYRHRGQLLCFFLIFAAAGFEAQRTRGVSARQ